MNHKFLICVLVFVLVILVSPVVNAVRTECYEDGSVLLEGVKEMGPARMKRAGSKSSYVEVRGGWKPSTKEGLIGKYDFLSDEAIFIQGKKTRYYVKVGKRRYSVTCPPFKFSCKAMNVSVNSCYNRNETFVTKFMVYNIPLSKKKVLRFGNPFSLTYTLAKKTGGNLVHAPDMYSNVFKDINMTVKKLSKGNKYTLRSDVNFSIRRFAMRYECRRSTFYEGAECTEMPTCKSSWDCETDEYCNGGICDKLECEDCQYIKKHKCVDYECCDSDVCAEDESCVENECKEFACKKDEKVLNHSCALLSCADDEHTVNHECVKLDCAEDEFAQNHVCNPLNCKDNEKIEDHKCVKLWCIPIFQKKENHECVSVFSPLFADEDGDEAAAGGEVITGNFMVENYKRGE